MCKTNLWNRRSGGRGHGKHFGSAAAAKGKKIQDFYENLENEKIAKNIKKIDGNR